MAEVLSTLRVRRRLGLMVMEVILALTFRCDLPSAKTGCTAVTTVARPTTSAKRARRSGVRCMAVSLVTDSAGTGTDVKHRWSAVKQILVSLRRPSSDSGD